MRSLPAIVLLATLTACGSGDDDTRAADPTPSEPPTPRLEKAFDVCKGPLAQQARAERVQPRQVMQVAGDGLSLVIATPSPAYNSVAALAFDTARCVLTYTEAPPTIYANMQSTTGMMGRQRDEYDGMKVQWSYFSGYENAGFQATFDDTAS